MTEISEFYPYIRHVLGDTGNPLDADDNPVPQFSDYSLKIAVKLVVQMGKVPGYALDEDEITPEIDPVTKPDDFGLVVYWSAKTFASALTDFTARIRAGTISQGNSKELITEIFQRVYDLENGEMCA